MLRKMRQNCKKKTNGSETTNGFTLTKSATLPIFKGNRFNPDIPERKLDILSGRNSPV